MYEINFFAPENIPEIIMGNNIGKIIIDSLEENKFFLFDKDVIIIAHKIISKAEGRLIPLSKVLPTEEAIKLSCITGKDPRIVQLILDESEEIIRVRKGLIIARHKLGFICANAAIDQSNAGVGNVILLPKHPDKSARDICNFIKKETGKEIAVIINDSHGRAFREGAIGVAIGISGMKPMLSYIGREDRYGYVMRSSKEAIADEISSAATLLMGQSNESRPIVIMRGYSYEPSDEGMQELLLPPEKDLFA